MKKASSAALILVLAWCAAPAFAQQAASGTAAKAIGPSQAALAAWNEIGRKVIAMAEDFPEDKYDFKPHPTQRSFAEQLLHVAGANDYFTDVAQGKKPTDDESRANHKTKADIVAYVKKSFADGAALIQKEGDAGMTRPVVEAEGGRTVPLYDLAYGLAEHNGEHYGQLVVYYRVAGLVPPESRPKK
ncbi:MAG TPA: DinB family protein [Terriglobales bacterium]|nr:DinB family protein [Terriglobales bacterium]